MRQLVQFVPCFYSFLEILVWSRGFYGEICYEKITENKYGSIDYYIRDYGHPFDRRASCRLDHPDQWLYNDDWLSRSYLQYSQDSIQEVDQKFILEETI